MLKKAIYGITKKIANFEPVTVMFRRKLKQWV